MAEKIKIAVAGTRGFPGVQGGVEAHCENLYPLLAALGCEVTVFTRRPYVNPKIKEYLGVRLIPLSCPRKKALEPSWHTVAAILSARKIQPDIIHFHAVGPALFIPLAKILGYKVVFTHHGPDFQRKKWGWFARKMLELGEFFGCKLADQVICIAPAIADDLFKKYGRKSTVIPNGVNIPNKIETEEALRKFGLEKGRYFLAVGRFVPEKGFHDLMAAFSMAALNGWKLVIVGAADHPDAYSQSLKEKAAGNKNIVLTGFLSGQPLAELYIHAGLFVLPSYYEGLPIVLLEALSYGLSCLASDIPANLGILSDNLHYFPPGRPEKLAEKLQRFSQTCLTDAEKNTLINFLKDNYSWPVIAGKTRAIYQKTIGFHP